MVEAWGIRGWSLKVREEPLSTGSSQNESCYLILLSTLLRFIRQLLDALQYAANRARIVCRRSPPLSLCSPFPPGVPLLHFRSFPQHDAHRSVHPFRVRLSALNTWPLSVTRLRVFMNVFFVYRFSILWIFYYRALLCRVASFVNKIPTMCVDVKLIGRKPISIV